MELVLSKRHERGAATFIEPNSRARVIMSRKMFDGEPPESLEIDGDGLHVATDAEIAKAKARAERGQRADQKRKSLDERVAKAKAKFEKLSAQLQAKQGGEQGQEANA